MNPTYYSEATETEQLAFRKWIKDMLHIGPMSVTFIKTDGTERTMVCTLQQGAFEAPAKKTERTKSPSDEQCSVWDTEKQAWRSFRYDSITKISFDL